MKLLKSVRVVEMGTYITGPAAAMHLGDLGADVIKVERPETGDPFRAYAGGLYAPHFQTYNRNKRSIALDTKLDEDRALFHQLIAGADVFIQNFRPGVADALGASEDELRTINPGLIYCAISGFGPDGPYRDRPAFDTVAQAAAGYLRLLTPPGDPRVIGPAIADSVTGQYAAMGILAALVERRAYGAGRRLDISMLEAMCHFNLDSFTHYFSVGRVMDPLSRPRVSQSFTFPCADGKAIAIHLSAPPKFWQGLTEAVGRPDLQQDPRFADRVARSENHDALIKELRPLFAQKQREEWCEILLDHQVPFSPAYDSYEALSDPQAEHLRIAIDMRPSAAGSFKTVRPPYSFDHEVDTDLLPPPLLDEHGASVRAHGWAAFRA